MTGLLARANARARDALSRGGPLELGRQLTSIRRWQRFLHLVMNRGRDLDAQYERWLSKARMSDEQVRTALGRLSKPPRITAWLLPSSAGVDEGFDGAAQTIHAQAFPPVDIRPFGREPRHDEVDSDFVLLLYPDVRVDPLALLHVAHLVTQPEVPDLIYFDEDRLGGQGRYQPFFKPDWDIDLHRGYDYLGRCVVARRAAIEAVGGLRPALGPNMLYDLELRMTGSSTARVAHIPAPLFSIVEHSDPAEERTQGTLAAVVAEEAQKDPRVARVDAGSLRGSTRVHYQILDRTTVGIVIPTRDRLPLLRRCISSVLERSTYRNFQIIVVDNDSQEAETLDYMEKMPIMVVRCGGAFNFSKALNQAAGESSSDVLLFLNNDTEVRSPDWLEAMLEHCLRAEVGVVGARLVYPDGTPQHEGVGIDRRGNVVNLVFPDHIPLGMTVRRCSDVSAACMMLRRSVFDGLGGFDTELKVGYNDVDLCLRAVRQGYAVVYTPYAELLHEESASRGRAHPTRDERFFRARWDTDDPFEDEFMNPNLVAETPLRIDERAAKNLPRFLFHDVLDSGPILES